MRQTSIIKPVSIFYQKLFFFLFLGVLASAVGCASFPAASSNTYSEVTQVSTYPALAKGLYQGEITYDQLERTGDFGMGTFTGMDGEMIALDGKFYQARVDGSIHLADKTMKSPFAVVHFFQSKKQVTLPGPIQDYDQLKINLNQHRPTANNPCAFKIAGTFSYLKIRSVPPQSEPYPLLDDVIARQATFELRNIKGTMVGYWFPEFLAGLNVPGYHLHFISDDKKHGGHVLECGLTEARVDIDYLQSVKLLIPQNPAFQRADFSQRLN